MIKPTHQLLKDIIKIYGKNLKKISLSGVSLAEQDLRELIFKKDRNFFQKIKDKSLFSSKLPDKNYSRYNFNNVLIKGVQFGENTILPKDKNFFRKIKNRDISKCTMPLLNYQEYSFKNVCIKNTKFPPTCFLSENYSFFKKIKYKDCTNTQFPQHMIENLHLYDLNGIKINLQVYDLTPEQIFIIMHKRKQ